MPFLSSIEGNYAFGKPRGGRVVRAPYESLDQIAGYCRNFMPDFRNPSFYVYRLDGNGKYIFDGGGDMFDNGNVVSPWLRAGTNYTQALPYTPASFPAATDSSITVPTVTDTDLYYVSLGYIQYTGEPPDSLYHPLTVMSARSSIGAPVGWQVGGNSGADTSGNLASGILYSGQTIQGFQVHAFYRETWGAGSKPSHCNLYILLGHPLWDSVFGTIYSFADPVSNGGCGGYFYTAGASVKNILSVQTLLSKAGGAEVTAAECRDVVDNFCLRIRQSLAF